MTDRFTRRAALAVLAAAPAACAAPSFNRPAGETLLDPNLGASTMQNMQVHMGQGAALAHLNGRFSAAVQDTVNFAFNRSHLDGRAREILRRQAHFIRQFPEVRFSVIGHTDAVGTEGYNRDLGLRRARTVVRYLASQGVSTDRLVAVVSEGETELVVNTGGPSRANRRAVTQVGGFMAGDGRTLDGKYARIVYRQYVVSAQ
ncbi:OmpA family protein [Jannaschia sp. Os4]|uniref:OmpA family protein n=1 Tax=Jannaschia sp. Os4 TaxID=2807617 RepID=UPI001939F50D|nr:OmpA family protein [Jannaschia sp. Os4]MBM2574847.1 OmpA family protein [Jannaschia sp. Os4]